MTGKYIVELLTEHGDWIRHSFHNNIDHAQFNAATKAEDYKVRIIKDGQIVQHPASE
jgi:hypothetical protein